MHCGIGTNDEMDSPFFFFASPSCRSISTTTSGAAKDRGKKTEGCDKRKRKERKRECSFVVSVVNVFFIFGVVCGVHLLSLI